MESTFSLLKKVLVYTIGFLDRSSESFADKLRNFVKPPDGFFSHYSDKISNFGLIKFIRALEPLAIAIALVALFSDLSYRREQRTARAWELLSTPISGNSGKAAALQFLNHAGWMSPFVIEVGWLPWTKQRTSLVGIDLIPPVLAQQWKVMTKG